MPEANTKSILNRTEVSRAQFGPRQLKDPRSKEYAIQTLYALKRYSESLRCDQALVAKELAEIDQYQHWKVLGYPTRDAMIDAELSEIGRRNVRDVQKTLATAPELQPHGGARQPQGNPITLIRGTNPSYLAARIKRDHPEIVARIEAGEFKSMKAAARAAGIVQVRTPLEQLSHWWNQASAAEREAFRKQIA